MGQGLYDGIGFGMLNPPDELSEHDDLCDVLSFSYESNPRYGVVLFGVSDGWLQEWWGVGPVPEDAPRVKRRTAKECDFCVHVPHYASATWEMVRSLAETRGIELPAGHLIVFNDWD